MIKKKFKIIDMHCTSCALTIDMNLEDLDGVKIAKTNFAKSETEIEYDPKKVEVDTLLDTIKNTGYTAKL